MASGLGLVVLVVFDLRESVRAQDALAADVSRRDAQRGARELATALGRAEVLERVPDELRFQLEDAALLIPAEIAWLEPPPPFDPAQGMDAVARDKLARARREDRDGELYEELLTDPILQPPSRNWVSCRLAWRRLDGGDFEGSEELLAALDTGSPPAVAASALLLDQRLAALRDARSARPTLDWAHAALTRFPDARADAVLDYLAERGVPVAADRDACAGARATREVLRRVTPLVPLLAAASAPERRGVDGALLLYFPDRGEGALLDFNALQSLAASLAEEAPPLVLGGTLIPYTLAGDAPRVVEGVAVVRPAEVRTAGLASGAGGLALLVVALSACCGGGAFLALRGARREAEAARLRGEFVTGVTHELKTPLAGIRLTADLLADGHITEESQRALHLSRLSGEALRLGVLIENVLDLGRLERGERGHRPQAEELVGLVRETLELFEPLAERDEVELRFDEPQEALPVFVDRDSLRQAFLNVLDNARKYGAPEDGSPARVEVEVLRDGNRARLRVRDHGSGLQPAEREALFERFRRGARHGDGSIPGVGLGLYLARELLRGNDGDLLCVDPPGAGGGACFELVLPLHEEPEEGPE